MRKANKRFFLLLHYKHAGVPQSRLRDIYVAMTRSILEFSSNVYHSQLNKHQTNELERIQKRCLRAVYGYEKTYEELLHLSGLDTLEDRRTRAFEKFAKKTLKNEKYSAWFPLKPPIRTTRSKAIYLEEKAVGNRLFKSPIFAMRRVLNRTETSEVYDMSGLFNAP